MRSLGELFDAYSRRARLMPALLVLFPVLVTVAVWANGLYHLGSALVSLAVACGLLYYLANIARSRGRKLQEELYAAWGGKPSVTWLRHRDGSLDAYTKQRYHRFFDERVAGWMAPSVDEEAADPAGADARYESANRWLLEYSRDRQRYPLVFKENVEYGFRRNLLGLKSIGLATALLSSLVNALALLERLGGSPLAGAASLIVSLLLAAGWLLVVNPGWVRDAADGYARALLAACEVALVRNAVL